MLDRVATSCGVADLPILVVGRAAGATWKSELEFAPDLWPGAGPLGGLHTALSASGTDVLLVGCDMPWLSPDAVLWLIAQNAASSGGVVAERDRAEPLFAVYPVSCRDEVESRLRAGTRSLMGLIRELDLPRVSVPKDLHSSLDDADSPSDLEERANG